MKRKVAKFLFIGLTCALLMASGENVVHAEEGSLSESMQELLKEYMADAIGASAEITASGELENMNVSFENAEVSVLSYDLGYSGYWLLLGEEDLCIKMHVKNTSDKLMEIGNLYSFNAYVDGVEKDVMCIDFYGDNAAGEISYSTKIMAGAETDIYYCINCTVNESHSIELDFRDKKQDESGFYYESEEVKASFSFNTDVQDVEESEKENGEEESAENTKTGVIKSGELEGINTSLNKADVTVSSYDWGYSEHMFTKGEEDLCLKFHVKNTSDETLEIENLYDFDIYVDGVQKNIMSVDFYGDGRANEISFSTELKAGAETDIYYCVRCSVDEPHSIDIEFFDKIYNEGGYYSNAEDSTASFSFNID